VLVNGHIMFHGKSRGAREFEAWVKKIRADRRKKP
jgi:hypothetical protein